MADIPEPKPEVEAGFPDVDELAQLAERTGIDVQQIILAAVDAQKQVLAEFYPWPEPEGEDGEEPDEEELNRFRRASEKSAEIRSKQTKAFGRPYVGVQINPAIDLREAARAV